MRGDSHEQEQIWSRVSLEERIPSDHPLRDIRELTDRALREMYAFLDELYPRFGRPSIAPERLLRALLLQVLYSIRSERQLIEQMDYNLLFRWFVGLQIDDPVWDSSSFSKNRDRLLKGGVADEFFRRVLEIADEQDLLSEEHFTVDATLLEAAASLKSFQPKGTKHDSSDGDSGNPTINFHGQKRSNKTHESSTDPDSRLYRKGAGKESRLSYMGHVLMENRSGLVVMARASLATGYAEREEAAAMLRQLRRENARRWLTLGADKGYDTKGFVAQLKQLDIKPHIARKKKSAVHHSTARGAGYQISQKKRKSVEEIFGWMKTIGSCRKLRVRTLGLVDWTFVFASAAYNLVRIRGLRCA